MLELKICYNKFKVTTILCHFFHDKIDIMNQSCYSFPLASPHNVLRMFTLCFHVVPLLCPCSHIVPIVMSWYVIHQIFGIMEWAHIGLAIYVFKNWKVIHFCIVQINSAQVHPQLSHNKLAHILLNISPSFPKMNQPVLAS
jgi:hypothetical protein